jgi:hypothetical protein
MPVVFNRCAVSALEVCREKSVNSFISMYLYVYIGIYIKYASHIIGIGVPRKFCRK